MCSRNVIRIIPALSLLLALCFLAAPAQAEDSLNLTTLPGDISIGAGYTGTVLHIAGTAPQGSDIVVRFTGANGNIALRRKGKAFGLLWMNMGVVELGNVPSVYLVSSSRPLSAIGGSSLGLEAVRKGISVTSGSQEGLDIPAEFIKLKAEDGLYSEAANGVSVSADGRFSINLPIPSRMSPGAYSVDVFALRNGAVAGNASTPVTVKLVGAPAWIAHMAFDHSTLYGILSALVAIFAGLAIGIVFQSRGAH